MTNLILEVTIWPVPSKDFNFLEPRVVSTLPHGAFFLKTAFFGVAELGNFFVWEI